MSSATQTEPADRKGPGRPPAKTDPNQCTKPGCPNPKSNSESTNPWCADCWRAYLSGYRASSKAREMAKGFAAGVRAMKETLAQQMAIFGAAVFTGSEIAAMIRAVDTRDLERAASQPPAAE